MMVRLSENIVIKGERFTIVEFRAKGHISQQFLLLIGSGATAANTYKSQELGSPCHTDTQLDLNKCRQINHGEKDHLSKIGRTQGPEFGIK